MAGSGTEIRMLNRNYQNCFVLYYTFRLSAQIVSCVGHSEMPFFGPCTCMHVCMYASYQSYLFIKVNNSYTETSIIYLAYYILYMGHNITVYVVCRANTHS